MLKVILAPVRLRRLRARSRARDVRRADGRRAVDAGTGAARAHRSCVRFSGTPAARCRVPSAVASHTPPRRRVVGQRRRARESGVGRGVSPDDSASIDASIAASSRSGAVATISPAISTVPDTGDAGAVRFGCRNRP